MASSNLIIKSTKIAAENELATVTCDNEELRERKQKAQARQVHLISLVAVSSSSLLIIFNGGAIRNIAAAFTIAWSALAIYQRVLLDKLGSTYYFVL